MKLNKLFLLGLFAILSFSAKAQTATLYVTPEDNEVKSGNMVTIEVWYESDGTNLGAMDFQLFMPKGFSIELTTKGKIKVTNNSDEDIVPRTYIVSAADHTDAEVPYYNFVGADPSGDWLTPGENMLCSFNVVVPEDFTAENYPTGVQCHIGNMTLNDVDNLPGKEIIFHPEDSYFYILPTGISTGIEEINADLNGDDVVYNLQGMRVYPPLAPGMYIVNGKKIAVK